MAAILGLALGSLVLAALAWRLSTLWGLPNIGDPFDVAAFVSDRVRDEDNAFVLYRQADKVFRPWRRDSTSDWATASTEERKWLDDNREALVTWRRGTERPDASFITPEELTFDADLGVIQRMRDTVRLACLEASRLEAGGEFAAAWEWHRAILRSSQHCGRRGCMIERLIGVAIHEFVSRRVTNWSSSPSVDAKMLRKALDEVQAIDAMTPPLSVAVKCEYLSFQEAMSRPDMLWKFLEAIVRPPTSTTSDAKTLAKAALLRVEAFVKRDPERSRRLLRLVVANWLAYCDRPLGERPPLDPTFKLVYVTDPSAPPNARLLSPDRMNSWFESTIVLRHLMPAFDAMRNAIDRERVTQAALVVHLASELYCREHGRPPASPEDLVGPYLKELPKIAVPK